VYYSTCEGNLIPAEKHERYIDGMKIITWQRDIVDCNILEVEAGTNGYHGGDTGHGSRTYIRIENVGSTDMQVEVDRKPVKGNSVGITLGGDAELKTIKNALRWIVSVLETQSELA